MAFFTRERAMPGTRKTATHMTFWVNGQLYGVPVDMIAEVLALPRLAPLHTGDDAVVGEVESRGGALVVVDMGLRLRGVPIVPSPRTCLLIVRRAQARSGCVFDAPDGLASVPGEAVECSGCLVDEADGTAAIAPGDAREVENASSSGAAHGFALYQENGRTILLPGREVFYPR